MALTFPSSPTTGQVFAPGAGLPTWMWDGAKWTNATTPPLHLAQMTDVLLATPVNGQALTYNGTAWQNDGPLTATTVKAGAPYRLEGAGNNPAIVSTDTPLIVQDTALKGLLTAYNTGDIFARGVAITRARPWSASRSSASDQWVIDDYLKCYLPSRGTYRFNLDLILAASASGGVPGLALGVAFTGANMLTGSLVGLQLQPGTMTGIIAGPVGNVPPMNGWYGAYNLTSTNPNYWWGEGVFTIAGPGTFGCYWSANSGAGTTTMLAGSTMEVMFVSPVISTDTP